MKKKKKKAIIYYSQSTPKEKELQLKHIEATLKQKEAILEEAEKKIKQEIDQLNDTIHEVRKINNQIKANTLDLSKFIKSLEFDDSHIEKLINNTLKTLEANTSLLSIRMDAYDLMCNPDSANEDLEITMNVYSKVEKVYKCLYSSRKAKDLNIELIGNSNKGFRLRNSMELAFFIIIENAIKYSPIGADINITFTDETDYLEVKFENWGISPKQEELPKLIKRGYRSQIISETTNIQGNGYGLYLLNQICLSNNVSYRIETPNKSRQFDGISYNIFSLTLCFED